MLRSLLTVVLTTIALMLPHPAQAGRRDIVNVPLGWELDMSNGPFDIAPNGIAFVVYQYEDENRLSRTMSRVIQTEGSKKISAVDFEHSVTMVDYSPDGEDLIVHQWTPAHQTGEWLLLFRVTSLDRNGEVNWVLDPSRRLYFSTTGEVLYSFWNQTLKVFGRDGEEIREVDLGENMPPRRLYPGSWDAVLLGEGDRLVVLGSRQARCFDVAHEPLRLLWSLDLQDSDNDASGIHLLSEEHLLIDQERGSWMVIDTEGNIVYRHDLDDNVSDEHGERIVFSSGQIFAGATPHCVIAFRGLPVGMAVDLRTGDVSACRFPVCMSRGCVTRQLVKHEKIVFMWPTRLWINSLGN